MIKFYIEVMNRYGNFKGETFEGTKEEYRKMREIIENANDQESHSMYLENGDYISFGREIVSESIFMLKVEESK